MLKNLPGFFTLLPYISWNLLTLNYHGIFSLGFGKDTHQICFIFLFFKIHSNIVTLTCHRICYRFSYQKYAIVFISGVFAYFIKF